MDKTPDFFSELFCFAFPERGNQQTHGDAPLGMPFLALSEQRSFGGEKTATDCEWNQTVPLLVSTAVIFLFLSHHSPFGQNIALRLTFYL